MHYICYLSIYRAITDPSTTLSMEMTNVAVANPLTHSGQQSTACAEEGPEYATTSAQKPSVDVSHNIVTEENLAYATHGIVTQENLAHGIVTEENLAYATHGIVTQENLAYATHTIVTEENLAYATHVFESNPPVPSDNPQQPHHNKNIYVL